MCTEKLGGLIVTYFDRNIEIPTIPN